MNLTIVQNQIEGGVIQGLALTQAEEMRFDPRNGRCLNANFLDLSRRPRSTSTRVSSRRSLWTTRGSWSVRRQGTW